MPKIRKQRRGKGDVWYILLGITLIVVCISGLYVHILQRSMLEETNVYLQEVASRLSSMVDYRLSATLQNLHATATAYSQITDPEEAQGYLATIAKQYDFLCLLVSDEQGRFVTKDGQYWDLTAQSYIQKALTGEDAISDVTYLPDTAAEGIFCVVPCYEGKQVVGVLGAFIGKEKIQGYLNVNSFAGQGFAHIIEKNGDFVVLSQNANAYLGQGNYFTVLQEYGQPASGYSIAKLREDISQDKSGIFYFTMDDGISRVLAYQPLTSQNWYLLSVVPTQVTNRQMYFFSHLAIIINAIVVLLFVALIVFILLLQRQNQRRLEEMAFVDPVTLGPSRAKFEIDASTAIRQAAAGSYVLVAADIEKFKLINDAYGSEQGDRTLRYVYHIFQRHLAVGELTARITGDTFNLLLWWAGEERLLERLQQIVEDVNQFNHYLEQKYYLVFTVGIYVVSEPTLHLITMQDRANVARGNSKHGHTDSFYSCAFYTDVERRRLVREKEIMNRVSGALANQEFIVYLQPKVSLEKQQIAGAEALVRWEDEEHNIISPGEFIPILEKNGFIAQLDLYVFTEICRLLRKWLDEGKQPVPISVNLSRAHLRRPDFLAEFRSVCQRYQIPPQLLEMELTETLVFEDIVTLRRVMEEIHAYGFRCALDDFGSGYSSLNMLKDVPADVLKLDKAFFEQETGNRQRGNAVVESVIEMAKKLNMTTVAEGVEQLRQVEFLRAAKCDMVQGYVFSPPITISAFEKLCFETGKVFSISCQNSETK